MNLQANTRTADAPPGSLHPIVVPILPDSRIQGEPNGKTKPLTINNNRALSAAAGLSLEGGALTHALSLNGNGVGHSIRIRNPEHRAKAERFWENLSAKRKQPGNCCRCGKPHDGEYRQCDPCRVRVAALKAKRQVKEMTLAECVVIVKQCRREVTKLREIIKQMKRHYEYRRNKRWQAKRTLRKYADAYPQISKQEAAQISHAYESEDAR
ncbi:MAG: hypothetical protein IPK82_23415 [Polyangiaceae bacterium]|nr:hypothetical protein [Polyangiaceae bacterium]